MASPFYSAGTVSLTFGTNPRRFTGTGTAWLTAGIMQGDRIKLAGTNIWALIDAVNSNTQIDIAEDWPGGGNVSNANYIIELSSPLRVDTFTLATEQRDVLRHVRILSNTEKIIAIDAFGLTAPAGSEVDGALVVVAASGATGPFADKANRILRKDGSAWADDYADIVRPGWIVYVKTTGAIYFWNGTVWAPWAGSRFNAVVANLAGRAAYNGEAANFTVLVESDSNHSNDPWVYTKKSATSGDWSDGFPIRGLTGAASTTSFALTGVISPSQLTTDQNNYNPTNLENAFEIRHALNADRVITGLAGGAAGRFILHTNLESSRYLILEGESASSSAANRFAETILVLPGHAVLTRYDSTTQRWRPVGMPVGRINGAVGFLGILSPSQLTANQDNFNPTGLSSAAVLRLTSDAARTITGLAGGFAGRTIWLYNRGSNDIVLAAESASSTAANRFDLPFNISVRPKSGVALQYDGTSSRWVVGNLNLDGDADPETTIASADTLNLTNTSGRLVITGNTIINTIVMGAHQRRECRIQDGVLIAHAAALKGGVARYFPAGSVVEFASDGSNTVREVSRSLVNDEVVRTYEAAANQWKSSRTVSHLNGIIRTALPELPVPPGVSFTRSNKAWDFGPNGDLREYPPNVIRHAYDPGTRKYLGWRYSRRTRTNAHTNNTMVGAVAGAIGSGGAIATGWAVTDASGADGITKTIALGTYRGQPYMSIRCHGTPNTTASRFLTGPSITSSVGQVWTQSAWLALSAGSLANINLGQFQFRSGGESVSAYDLSGLSASPTRIVNTATLTATSAQQTVRWNYVDTVTPVDFTLFFWMPQSENQADATTPIPTAGIAVTVPAETLSENIPAALWSPDQFILMFRGIRNGSHGGGVKRLISVDDGTTNNRASLQISDTAGNIAGVVVSGGSTVASLALDAVENNAEFVAVLAVQANNFAAAKDGEPVLTDVSGAVPSGLSPVIAIGYQQSDALLGEIVIQQYAYIPLRGSNTDVRNASSRSSVEVKVAAYQAVDLAIAAAAQGRAARKGWPMIGGPRFIAIPEKPLPSWMSLVSAAGKTSYGPNGDLRVVGRNEPRHHYDLATGLYRGVAFQTRSYTQVVPNSAGVGGSPGTPGVNPTGWVAQVFTTTGMTVERLATISKRGMSVHRWRVTGTASGVGSFVIASIPGSGAAASLGQVWRGLVWASLTVAGGSATPTTYFRLVERNAGGSAVIYGTAASITAGAGFSEIRAAHTTSHADVAFVDDEMASTLVNGQTYDFTVEYAVPTIAQTTYILAPVITTGTALTVTGDLPDIVIPAVEFNPNAMAVYIRGTVPIAASGGTDELLGISDGTTVNLARLTITSTGNLQFQVNERLGAGGSQIVNSTAQGAVADMTEFTAVMALAADNFAYTKNGAAITSFGATRPMPQNLQPIVQLGRSAAAAMANCIFIKEVGVFSTRPDNAVLPTIGATGD